MIRLSYRASRMVQGVFLSLSLLLSMLWAVSIGKATDHYAPLLLCFFTVAVIVAASFLPVLDGDVPRSGRWTYPLLTAALLAVTIALFASLPGHRLPFLTEVRADSLLEFAAGIYTLLVGTWLFPLLHLATLVCGVLSTLMALPSRRIVQPF